jgi:hypothetical protein
MLRAALAAAAVAGGVSAAPLPVADPLGPGTRWVGELTQKGTFGNGQPGPPAFRVVFTVTARDDDRFEADLDETAGDVRVVYGVKGTIVPIYGEKRYAVRFVSVAAREASNTVPVLGIPYTGRADGEAIRGTWKIPPNADGTTIEGGFAVKLVPRAAAAVP